MVVRLQRPPAASAEPTTAPRLGGVPTVQVEPATPVGATLRASPARGDAEPPRLRPIAKWSALGLAGAGLAVGITTSLIRSNSLDEFKSAHGGGCFDRGGRGVDSAGNDVSECQGPLDTYNDAALAAGRGPCRPACSRPRGWRCC